ncbi:hypothetical protein OHS33_01555 [Streptomyces sp. NBC_00536]|uniref:hypothetical protein n=1 Tax=Streptomyces sp. NBC_00536 TaxID=2975769 RepID=UPI002E80018A|nr:hypothetical protein [Streptomyces sp. NBC_00536]WUC77149.1 hypothetical protein OHS33_01555 [Streptomyces sp. NBC_00536]
MRRLRVSVVPLLTAPVLALTACSGSGSGAGLGLGPDRSVPPASASPSASASAVPSAAAPVPPGPGTLPVPVPSAALSPRCTPTASLDTAALGAYIRGLRASDRAQSSYSALFMVDTGVYLRLKDAVRPCEPLRLKLTHFRVHIAKATPGSTTAAGFSFTYAPIETLTVSAGPGDGFAEGSKPPATEKCGGTLSVVYLGEEVTERELPSQLQFPKTDSTLDWTLADVSAERVLDAVFKPPPEARSC